MMPRPKYITFDCYGTLTNFRMGDVAREMYADRIPSDRMDAFVTDFAQYRLDEVMGDWRPYNQVLENAIRRTCRRHKVESRGGSTMSAVRYSPARTARASRFPVAM